MDKKQKDEVLFRLDNWGNLQYEEGCKYAQDILLDYRCDLVAAVNIAEQMWVIWSNEHDAWWRPNRNGYTTLYRDAGLYTYDEAVTICAGANWGCSGDGDTDRDGRARAGQGRPMETMLPAVGCYGRKGNLKHPEAA